MAEILALYSQRLIVNRHQKLPFYHSSFEVMVLAPVVDIPITF